MVNINRRDFLALLTATVAGPALLASCGGKKDVRSFFESKKKLKLSLSQWALHREQFGKSKEDYPQWQKMLQTDPDRVLQGTLNPLDFPAVAKSEFGMDAVEYVNTFFYGHGNDDIYLNELRKRSDHEGVRNLLIMVDEEGMLGDPDPALRASSVERHKKWLYAATVLGCHSIRVNLHSKGNKEEQMKLSADGLSQVCELAKPFNLHVIIENHGGMSSEPNWLIETIKATGKDNTGTMVDFDNFDYSEEKIWGGEFRYDRYEGVKLLLPYAKSVSSKAHSFDAQGFETSIDFGKMVNMIKESGFDGYTSVEYEGDKLTEREGVRATKALLERFDG